MRDTKKDSLLIAVPHNALLQASLKSSYLRFAYGARKTQEGKRHGRLANMKGQLLVRVRQPHIATAFVKTAAAGGSFIHNGLNLQDNRTRPCPLVQQLQRRVAYPSSPACRLNRQVLDKHKRVCLPYKKQPSHALTILQHKANKCRVLHCPQMLCARPTLLSREAAFIQLPSLEQGSVGGAIHTHQFQVLCEDMRHDPECNTGQAFLSRQFFLTFWSVFCRRLKTSALQYPA